ncbi:hypothetical protein [Kutzneria chonburiensis]|uniref:Uncharacterized protein n=1 Tax=Kutzneria chonburiensis TaxID=1483604 RepID=A0ABV6MKB8_9PSEU|nr:hypothetical protein [Kutzneria chonburiensis]
MELLLCDGMHSGDYLYTSEVSSMDFGLTKAEGQLLFDRGLAAGKAFLARM